MMGPNGKSKFSKDSIRFLFASLPSIFISIIPHMKTDHDILTPAQAAKLKGVSRTAIYNALADGRLKGVSILGRIGIARAVLKAWQPQARVGRPAGQPMKQEAKEKLSQAQKQRWARRKTLKS